MDPSPSGFGADVDAAVGHVRTCGAVEGNDDRDGAGPLTVGPIVVGAGVLDPVVAVRVDLRDPGHPFRAQVVAGGADRLGWHDIVPRSQDRVRDDDGHRDVHRVPRRGAGVSGLVNAVPVEVSDPFDSWRVLGEQVQDGLPESLGNTGLDGHATLAWAEGPRYA